MCLYAAECCVLYHLPLALWIFGGLVVTAWRPSCPSYNPPPPSPRRRLVRRVALCAWRWRRAKQARRACATSIPLGSGRRCGLSLLGAVYLCRGLFVPLKNVEHPLWLFRPRKNCLSTLVPARWNTGVEGCDYGRLQITRKEFWKRTRKMLHLTYEKRTYLRTNVRRLREDEEAKAAMKAGVTWHELGRMVVMCQLPHDSKRPVLAVWAQLLRNREDNAAQYLSRHQCGNTRHLAVKHWSWC